jgi:hypothetical protein
MSPARTSSAAPLPILVSRIQRYAWPEIARALDERGWAHLPQLLDPEQCRSLRALYTEPGLFRSRVVMARHGYGHGEYQYFARPLPAEVALLREALYPPLASIANVWAARLGQDMRYPDSLPALAARCAELGQTEPTPLILKYGPDGENRLHQDLYGELVFPLQVVTLLSDPAREFSGGELVLTEQRARMQSRVEVVPLALGDAAVFAVADRPITSKRGYARVKMRHGVSRVLSGDRYTLGVIFHDARP